MQDSCNATERVRSQLKICNRPMNHPERTHQDGDHEWPVEGTSYVGESSTEVRREY